jgi:hypothetical protein
MRVIREFTRLGSAALMSLACVPNPNRWPLPGCFDGQVSGRRAGRRSTRDPRLSGSCDRGRRGVANRLWAATWTGRDDGERVVITVDAHTIVQEVVLLAGAWHASLRRGRGRGEQDHLDHRGGVLNCGYAPIRMSRVCVPCGQVPLRTPAVYQDGLIDLRKRRSSGLACISGWVVGTRSEVGGGRQDGRLHHGDRAHPRPADDSGRFIRCSQCVGRSVVGRS